MCLSEAVFLSHFLRVYVCVLRVCALVLRVCACACASVSECAFTNTVACIMHVDY